MDCYTLLNTFRGTVVSVTQGWLYLAYPVAYNALLCMLRLCTRPFVKTARLKGACT